MYQINHAMAQKKICGERNNFQLKIMIQISNWRKGTGKLLTYWSGKVHKMDC